MLQYMKKIPALLVGCAVLLTVNQAQAANRTWKAGVSGNFSVASNWINGLVPTATDTAVLPKYATNYTVTLDQDQTIINALIGTGAAAGTTTLSIPANTLTLNGPGNTSTNAAGGVLSVSGGTVTGAGPIGSNGLFNFTAGTISGSGNFTNGGTLIINGSPTLARSLTNNGIVNFQSGSVAATTTLTNRGTFNALSGTSIGGAGFSFVNQQNSVLNPGGVGTTGTFGITGTFQQFSSGTTNFDVVSDANFDVINITGAATLAGTAAINDIFGVQPDDLGIEILTYASKSGSFNTVTPGNLIVATDPTRARVLTKAAFINRQIPKSAPVGGAVSLSGHSFNGATAVRFVINGTTVDQTSFTVTNDPGRTDGSKVSTTVPAGLPMGTGTVQVLSTNGDSNTKPFEVTS